MKTKKFLSLFLALVLTLSLLPAAAWAEETTSTVTVQISNPSEYKVTNGAAFEGALDLNGSDTGTAATVSITAGETALQAVEAALNTAKYSSGSQKVGGYNVTYGGTYLESINGLTAGDATKAKKNKEGFEGYDGWCCAINDIAPAVGLNSIYVSNSDVIRLEYSLDMTVSNTTLGSGNNAAGGFGFSAGTLTSTGSAEKYNLALTLTLPESAQTVQITETPCKETPVLVYDAKGISHALKSDISVSNGDVLQIVGGSYKEVYNVKINIIGADDIDALLSKIAAGYTDKSSPWNVIDMSAYHVYAPTSTSVTSAGAKQALVDSAITAAQAETVKEGDIAKNILALQSVGINPAILYPPNNVSAISLYDVLDKTDHASIYNVGYVTLHAYRQGKALTADKAKTLFTTIENSAKNGKYIITSDWGADIDTPAAILATVAPFASASNDTYGVKARAVTIRDAIISELSAQEQNSAGSFGNANTDASVMIGLISAGIDPSTDERFKAESGASLLDGLLSYALTDLSGFGYTNNTELNDMATEQSFRALISMAQMLKNSSVSGYACDLYDFSLNKVSPATASNSPISFSVIPSDATVTVKQGEAIVTAKSGTTYDLPAGDYTYTVTCANYTPKSGSFKVTADDVNNHTPRVFHVSLASAASGGSSITVNFTLVGDTAHGDGTGTAVHVYKQDGGSGRTWISRKALTLPAGSTAFDAFDLACGNTITYIEKSASYIPSLTKDGVTLSEFTNGKNSGWLYLVNGVSPDVGLRDYTLKSGDEIVFYYTDDYTKEHGSESWGGGTTDTTVTVPITGGSTSAPVSATVSGTSATISATDAQIGAVKEQSAESAVTLDLSAVDKSVTNAVVPAKLVTAVSESEKSTGLTVALPSGSVTLDKTALDAVSTGGKDVSVSVAAVAPEKLSDAQKHSLGNALSSSVIVDASIFVGGEKQTSFGGGSVTVSVPYTPGDGVDTASLAVWYLADDGTISPMPGSYDPAAKAMRFTTPHLSNYVVVSFPFADVSTKSWYYGSAAYCYMNGLLTGTSATSFSPDVTTTRAMLVTILYRLAGSPAVTESAAFADVASGAWYEKAVSWAAANGIVTGVDSTRFAPDDALTREQAAAILYRYAKLKKLDTAQAGTSMSGYSDSAAIADYALPAMQWAVSKKLMQGDGGTLSPAASASRAQTSALLQRFAALSASK